jgi:hypothetical protein
MPGGRSVGGAAGAEVMDQAAEYFLIRRFPRCPRASDRLLIRFARATLRQSWPDCRRRRRALLGMGDLSSFAGGSR